MIKSFLSSTILSACVLLLSSSFQLETKGFNPTGTYEYDNGENGDGTVKVKKIIFMMKVMEKVYLLNRLSLIRINELMSLQ